MERARSTRVEAASRDPPATVTAGISSGVNSIPTIHFSLHKLKGRLVLVVVVSCVLVGSLLGLFGLLLWWLVGLLLAHRRARARPEPPQPFGSGPRSPSGPLG